ncbi:MAG: leucine-rich repeat domain-containing protein [Muribaculaceae bacterium]|nr:leucine-rich repeat domain-containing protein [Muribaculaceae bacterium]
MRKLKLQAILLTALCCLTYVGVRAAQSAQERVLPKTVQGVDYRSTLKVVPAGATFEDDSAVPMASVPAKDFTFDMIESWAGEGSNRAGLVIQWNCDGEKVALVFGYRWDGDATGADMIKAVAEANPRLYTLMQYTNVSSPTDPNGGYTINGFGWDADDDGDIRLIDTGHNNQEYTSATGFFQHPRGYVPGSGGSPDYDYDNWQAGDKDDFWQAGWYKGYWSYWVGSAPNSLGYSSWGASGRVLSDGAWDGWNYAPDLVSSDWKPFEAAPQPIPEGAKTEFIYEGIRYTLKSYTNKTVEATFPKSVSEPKYTGVVSIPETFVDEGITYTVVGIGKAAFQSSDVIEVNLPSTVTSIGESAFFDSKKLTKVNIHDGITSIGKYAFSDCPLTEIHIPSGLTEIPEGAFQSTNITTLTIPENITTIGTCAFTFCYKLEYLEIPATVKTMEEGAFMACDALKSVKSLNRYPITIDENVFDEAYDATLIVPWGSDVLYAQAEGWKNFTKVETFNTEVSEGDKVTIGGATYVVTNAGDAPEVKVSYAPVEGKPTAALIREANTAMYKGDIVVPASIKFQDKEYKVTALGDSCFFGAGEITSVVLPEGITAIPDHAFNMYTSGKSKLTSVTIPSTVTSIGKYAFQYCDALPAITLPDALTTLGANVFSQCKALESIVVPAGVTELPQYAFNYCQGIKSITLKGAVSKIGYYAFYMCQKLESMEFYEGLTSLPGSVLSSCSSLTSVKLPSTLTNIDGSAFKGCSALESIDLPASVTSIGSSTFEGCSKLAAITLPTGIKTIGMSAFKGCSSIKAITIPASVTKYDTQWFYGCTALEEVTLEPAMTAIQASFFRDCRSLTKITFGPATSAAAEADDDTADEVVLPEGLKSIGSYAFSGCTALNLSPRMPSTLTTISSYAFDGMKQLSAIELPEGFTTFGQYQFRNTSIKEVVIPSTVKSLTTGYLFYGMPSDTKVYVTNPAAVSCGTYTFRITSSTYVDLTVPSGTAAAFRTKSSYWKTAGVHEPELDVVFGASDVSASTADAKVVSSLSVDYAAAHPARFVTANEKQLDLAEVKLVYTEVTAENTASPEADEADDAAQEATAAVTDGKATVKLSDLKPNTKYSYRWVYTLGDAQIESAPGEFTTDASAAISGVLTDGRVINYSDGRLLIDGCEGAVVSVVAMNGAVCARFECKAESTGFDLNLPAGVYVVNIVGADVKHTTKIIVH